MGRPFVLKPSSPRVVSRRSHEPLAEAGIALRTSMQPLVEAATVDGTVASDIDPEAVVFFVRTVGLGLLLQRAAGLPVPDSEAWSILVERVVDSFGDKSASAERATKGAPQQ